MNRKFCRVLAILLSFIIFLQIFPSGVFALRDTVIDGKYKDSASDEAYDYMSEPIDAEDVDFSTMRLLVGTNDPSIFSDDSAVLWESGGVYLLSFESESETAKAYTYYSEKADFIDADIALFVADKDFTDSDAEAAADAGISAKSDGEKSTGSTHYDIAIIDTGVANDAADAISVIGGDGVDDNGHGTAMFGAIRNISDSISVLSIKAFNSHGVGYISDVYAAIMRAIERDADVISMSFAAERKTGGTVLQHAVKMARDAGIIVVGAAGNDDADAGTYLPGCLNDVYIVGACDESGVKLPTSNFGRNVLGNVAAGSSSEAAAKLSAMIALNGEACLKTEMNNGMLFEKSYGRSEDEIIPDMLIMDMYDGDKLYVKYYNLKETKPSDKNKLSYLFRFADSSAAGINADGGNDEGDTDTDTGAGKQLPGTDPNVDWSIPPKQDPTTQDSVTIERIYVRWLSSSSGKNDPAYFGLLDLDPETDEVRNQQFQIDFALSGQEPYEPGAIRVEIPAHLWLNRDGEAPGELTLAIPEDPDEGAEFVWYLEGDKIVITNSKTIAAASKVMIQGTFRNVTAHEMIDDTLSDPFRAVISIVTPQGSTVTMESNEIYAHIDTQVEAEYAGKTAYNSGKRNYDVWWESIPDGIPDELLDVLRASLPEGANPEDYGFVRWFVSGTALGNQPFDMYAEDTIAMGDDGEPLYGGIMLGASHALVTEENPDGIYPSEDGISVKAMLFHGYNLEPKTAYVWTAYPKSALPDDEIVNLPNTQTISVTGWDDSIETTQDAPASVDTKLPTEYKFIKFWNDNDNAAGMRPSYLYLYIYRSGYSSSEYWERITLTAADAPEDELDKDYPNYWTYTWSDEGQTDRFWVSEGLVGAAGYFDYRYDYDDEHRLSWQYNLTNTEYDSLTHTWKYTNSYTEGWIQFDLSDMSKSVEYKFSDYNTVSNRDSQSLNKLQRGEDVLVQYTLRATVSAAEQSEWWHITPNRFVLEDIEYIFNNNRTLTTNDVDIGAVTFAAPVLWNYIPESYDEVTGLYEREKIDAPVTYLYGTIGDNSEEWVLLAALEYGVVTPVYDGVTVDPDDRMRVNLPQGISKVRMELVSDEAEIVEMRCYVYLRVKPTEPVLEMLSDAFENSDYLRFTLYNKAHSYAEYAGDDQDLADRVNGTYQDLVDIATGYLHGRQFRVAASLEKAFNVTYNDVSNRRIRLTSTLTLTQQSNVLTREEYDDAIASGEIPNTRHGVYYDLLPYGVDPDISSITLGEGDSRGDRRGDSLVDAYVIEDYKGSGRNMLVVIVDLEDNIEYTYTTSRKPDLASSSTNYPTQGYKNSHTITFDSYISWDTILNANINLASLYNVAAYEAAEGEIGSIPGWEGEPDDPRGGNNITSVPAMGGNDSNTDLMTDLDKNTPDPDDPNAEEDDSFIYAGKKLDHDEIDVSALTELEKFVQVTGSGLWTDGHKNNVNVQEGGAYTYRLIVHSGTDTITQDIILLDSIENYIPTADDKDFGDNRWRGSLLSIDLTEIIAAGIKPVVYYCTIPDFDLKNYNESNENGVVRAKLQADDGVWTTKEPDDLSKVTAIAIDMSKTVDGEDFLLRPNESLSVYLHMRAPFEKENEHPDYFKDSDNDLKDTDGSDHLKNAHAYNNIYMDCQQTVLGVNTHDFVHNDYTKVGIYTQNLDVEKVWDDAGDADGRRPSSITVRLLANGVPNGEYVTLNDGNDWKDTFKRLLTYDEETGEYIVYTFAETVDYEGYEYDLSEEYDLTINREILPDGSIRITLTNKHEPEKIKIPIMKKWSGVDENVSTRPASITVRLYADGVFTGKILTIRPDSNGNWYGEFSELNKYRDHGTEILYTIVEDPVSDYKLKSLDRIMSDDGEDGIYYSFEIENEYDPRGDLIVRKSIVNAVSDAAKENDFTFWLRLEPVDGIGAVTDKYNYTVYAYDYDENGDPILDGDGNPTSHPTGRTGTAGSGDFFTLKGGEYIVIENIPTHVKYTVTEESTKGFGLTGTINETGEIISWTPSEADFTNTYTTRGYAQLQAQKILTGRTILARQFRFNIYDITGLSEEDLENGATGTMLRTAYNDADGKVTFGQIGYANADVEKIFTYRIEEYIASSAGYTYDKTVYTVTVVPHDNGDGTISCDITYYDTEGNPHTADENGNFDFIPEFNNEYHADGDLSFRAWKVLDGRDVAEGEFSFDFYSEDFVLLQTKQNRADGIINFDQIHYTEVNAGKTYWYYVREHKGDDDTVVYTGSILGYKVTVVDNGNGTLSFDQTAYDMTDAFTECGDCGGTGKIDEADCASCKGFGYIPKTADMFIECADCTGAGKISDEEDCETCGGFGYFILITDVESDCDICGGSGMIGQIECDTCGGSGKITGIKKILPTDSITPVFYNGLADGSLSVSKYINDGGDPNKEFHFRVKLIGDKVQDGEYEFEITEAPKRDFPTSDGSDENSGDEDKEDNGEETGEEIIAAATAVLKMLSERMNTIRKAISRSSSSKRDYSVAPMAVNHGGISASGESGSVTWEYYNDYTLVIRPTNGVYGSFEERAHNSKAPWSGRVNTNLIYYVEIQGNITLPGHSADNLFNGCQGLKSISGLENLDTGKATCMYAMFYYCFALQRLDLSHFDTRNVTSFYAMFWTCRSLEELNASSFDTSAANDMMYMFGGCSALTKLDISSFDTSNVTKVGSIFSGLQSVFEIKIGEKTFASNAAFAFSAFNSGNWVRKENINDPDATRYTASQFNKVPAGTYVWDVDCYKVYFDSGLFGGGNMEWAAVPVEMDYAIHQSRFIPTKSGYEVVAWKDTKTGTIYLIDDNGIAAIPANTYNKDEEISLVALWSKPSFELYFDPGAVSVTGTMEPQTVKHNKDIIIDNLYIYPDHTFTGWMDEINALRYDAENGVAMIPAGSYLDYTVDDGITLTAQWQILGYTIIFDANGTAGSMVNAEGSAYKDYILPNNKFVNYGNRFIGWQDKDHPDELEYYFPLNNGAATIPANTYSVGGEITLIPVWEKVDTRFTIVDGEFDFWLRGGEMATFNDIPAGTAYQVWEETPDGWVLIQQVGTSGEIKPLETSEAEFYNLYQPDMTAATIIGTKLLDGHAANSDANGDPFIFELYEMPEDGTEVFIEEVEVQTGGFIRFSTIFYKEDEIGTHTYIVREKRGTNPDIQYDSHEERVIVTVERVDGNLSSTVTYDDNASAVSFANLTKPGSLEISKVGDGLTDKNKDTVFTFLVKLYNANGTPIDSGSFPWYVKDTATGEIISDNTQGVSYLYRLIMSALSKTEFALQEENKSQKEEYASAQAADDTPADHGEILGSGTSGTSGAVTWIVYEDGTLLVEPTNGTECTWNHNFNAAPWSSYSTKIVRVETNGTIHMTGNVGYLFRSCSNLTDISGLENWDMSGAKALSNHNYLHVYGFFEDCSKLSDLTPLSGWNVGNSEYFQRMFYGCSSITDLTPLSNWDLSSAIDIGGMFYNCKGLETLAGLELWNIANVKTSFEKNSGSNIYHGLFRGCTKLTDISALADWDTGNIGSFQFMFAGCTSLTDLTPLTDWDVSGASSLAAMFYGCTMLVRLSGLEEWEPLKATTFSMVESSANYGMFYGCTNLTDITALSDWNVSSVSNMRSLFQNCSSLRDISPLSDWNTSSLTNLAYAFYSCNIIDASPLAHWNTPKISNIAYTFYANKNLETADFSDWDTSNITEAANLMNFLGRGDKNITLVKITFGVNFFNFADNFTSEELAASNLGIPDLSTDRTTGYWINENEQNWHPSSRTARYTSVQLSTGDNIAVPATYVWEYLPPYTVTFDSGGGSGSMSDMTGLVYEDFIIPKNQFVRLGYVFDGWLATAIADDAEPGTAPKSVTVTYDNTTGTYKIAQNACDPCVTVTLTPIWKSSGHDGQLPYYVYHYQQNAALNGYTLAAISVHYAEPGAEVQVPAEKYAGFITPREVTETVPKDSVLYVSYYYDRVQYTLHFDGNGAEYGEMDDIQMIGEIAQRLPDCGFSKAGCLFIGWNTTPEGDGTPYSTGQSVKNLTQTDGDTVTLYAQWIEIGNSSEPTSGEIIVKCKAGQTIVIPDLPAGTTYEIYEIEVPYGWSVTDEVGVNGTIYANTISSASVTNSYSASGVATIVAHKNLEGSTLESNQFEFELYAQDTVYSHTPNIDDANNQNGNYANNLNLRDIISIPGAESLHVKLTYQTQGTSYDALLVYKGVYKGVISSSATGYYKRYGSTTKQTVEFDIEGDTVTFGFYSNASTSYYGYYAVVTADIDKGPVKTAVNGPVDKSESSLDEDGNIIENPWYDWASATFDNLEYTKPGEYKYYIREKIGNDSTVEYDEHIEYITVVVTDNGDGTLAAEVVYEKDHDGAPFINKMKTGSLTVSKTLQNATGIVANKRFEFKLELKDSSGNPLTGVYKVVKSDGTAYDLTVTDGIAQRLITIKGGETFTVSGLPHGAQYTVTETEEQAFTLLESDGTTGTITGGETSEASFTNIYSAANELPLSAMKIFTGGKLETGMFWFELIDEATGNVLQTVTADENGNIEFTPIDYTQDDVGKTYTYRIREITDKSRTDIPHYDNVDYDAHTEIVTVKVENNENGDIILIVTSSSGSGGSLPGTEDTSPETDEDLSDSDDSSESGEEPSDESEDSSDSGEDSNAAAAGDIVFENLALYDLEVSKIVTGDGDQGVEYSFLLTLENADYDLTELTYRKNGSIDRLLSLWSDEYNGYMFTLKHGETISFLNLPYGTVYTITELVDGYITTVKMAVDGEETVIQGKEVNGEISADILVQYENYLLFLDMPGAGGIGIISLYLLGISLIIAGAWLVFFKFRYYKEESNE